MVLPVPGNADLHLRAGKHEIIQVSRSRWQGKLESKGQRIKYKGDPTF